MSANEYNTYKMLDTLNVLDMELYLRVYKVGNKIKSLNLDASHSIYETRETNIII